MTNAWKWFLSIIASLALTLGGLFWDALIHSQEHGHTVEESLFNLSNPGHVLFGAGLMLTTWIALAGFTLSWFDAQRHAPRWRTWSIPIVAWLMAGLLGAITLIALAQA